MRSRKWIFLVLFLVLPVTAQDYKKLCGGFFPENDMWIPEHAANASGIGRKDFDDILNRLQTLYNPEFAKFGAKLVIERHWSDGTVNAYAFQNGNSWYISMFGGFARHKAITGDGFAAVACHEIGHHMGGSPRWAGDWASVEGQSDYYATTKCLKRFFENDDNDKILAGMIVDPVAQSTCQAIHGGKQDQQLCIRATMAAVSLAGVLAEFDGVEPHLDTPDPNVVSEIEPNHPEGQCRLDTYFEGALCRVSYWDAVSASDPSVGYCYDKTTFTRGLRPLCWYAP